jgi:5'-nucleotidase
MLEGGRFKSPLLISGEQVFQCLENGVSQFPKLEGRFPQVSGIKFAFDPKKPPGERVDRELVRIGDEYVDKDAVYHMVSGRWVERTRFN